MLKLHAAFILATRNSDLPVGLRISGASIFYMVRNCSFCFHHMGSVVSFLKSPSLPLSSPIPGTDTVSVPVPENSEVTVVRLVGLAKLIV